MHYPDSDSPEHHGQRSDFIRKLIQHGFDQPPINDRHTKGTLRTIVQACGYSEVPLLCNETFMSPQQGIGRDYRVEFEEGMAPYRLGLACQKSSLRVAKPNPLSALPFFEQSVLCLEELNHDPAKRRPIRWDRRPTDNREGATTCS